MLGMRVKKETVRLGLHRDLELDSVPDKPYTAEELERLDAFTEEIANEKMLGAYYTMGEPYSERDLLQTTLAVSADALAYETAKADRDKVVPVAIGVALKCLGSSPACYLILAMIADVIDHIEYRTGIRTDGLTMSIYSSLMVAATPICNSIFSALLAGSGYNQAADVALGTAAQTAAVQSAISVSYIWVETVCYIIGGLLLLIFWTVEKNLPAEQTEIAARKAKQ